MKKYLVPFVLLTTLAQANDYGFEVDLRKGIDLGSGYQNTEYGADFYTEEGRTRNLQIYFSDTESVLRLYNAFTRSSLEYNDLPDQNLIEMADDIWATYQEVPLLAKIEKGRESILVNLMATTIIHNPSSYQSTLESVSKELTFADKIIFAREFGSRLEALYNHNISAFKHPKGFVSFESLMSAIRDKNSDLSGICGDVSWAQTKILKALGVESYIIGYKHLSHTGKFTKHAKVVALNPDNEREAIGINYGNVEVHDAGKGSSAISDNSIMPDIGNSIKIFDSEGNILTEQSTDLGKILAKASGDYISFHEDSSTYDTLIVSANMGGLNMRYFEAVTANKKKARGVGANLEYITDFKNLMASLDIGVAYARATQETMENTLHQQILYYRAQGKISYMPEFLPFELYASYEAKGNIQWASYKDIDTAVQGELAQTGNIGIKQSVDINENIVLSAYGQIDGLYASSAVYSDDSRPRIMKNIGGIEVGYFGDDFTLEGSVEYVNARYGNSLNTRAAFNTDNYSIVAQANKPLDDTPIFIDGAQEKYKFSLQYKPKENIKVSTGVEYNVDLDDYIWESKFQVKF